MLPSPSPVRSTRPLSGDLRPQKWGSGGIRGREPRAAASSWAGGGRTGARGGSLEIFRFPRPPRSSARFLPPGLCKQLLFMLLQIISKFRKPGNKRAFVQSVRSPELGDNEPPAPPPHPWERLQPHERSAANPRGGGPALPAGRGPRVGSGGARGTAGWEAVMTLWGRFPGALRAEAVRTVLLGSGSRGSLSQGAAGAPRAARPLPRFSGGRCHLWKTPGIHRAAGAAPGSVAVPCGTPEDEPRPRPPSPQAPGPLRAGPEGGGRGSVSGWPPGWWGRRCPS